MLKRSKLLKTHGGIGPSGDCVLNGALDELHRLVWAEYRRLQGSQSLMAGWA